MGTTAAATLTMDEATTYDKAEWSKAMDVYSFEPSIYEVWADLHEFYYGNVIFAAFLNSTVTETAQRMNAMENAPRTLARSLARSSCSSTALVRPRSPPSSVRLSAERPRT